MQPWLVCPKLSFRCPLLMQPLFQMRSLQRCEMARVPSPIVCSHYLMWCWLMAEAKVEV